MTDHLEYLGLRFQNPPTVNSLKLPKVGQTLPNGAILLDEETIREYDHRRDSIVLCVHASPYTPFITWHRILTTDSPMATGAYQVVDTCAIGEYFKTLDEAMTAFADRVTKRRHALEF